MIYLDTHVVAWLYAGRVDLIPDLARSLIEGNELLISPMVGLELQYLYEIGRTGKPAEEVLATLRAPLGLVVCDLPFEQVATTARDQNWTRDPFDRIIVSHAVINDVPLLTRDRAIQDAYQGAAWDGRGAAGR